MASASTTTTTMAFSCSSLYTTLKLPQNQTPLLQNFPLSKPISKFPSSSSLSFQRLNLSPISAFKKGSKFSDEDDDEEEEDDDDDVEEDGEEQQGNDSDSDDITVFRKNALARPKLSDVLPDDIEIPKPGTPEYDAILEKLLPKKSPPPSREEIFAVVMVGSRQYIVIPGRWIITQRLKGANVNDKIVLNKVLLVGTKNSTYIGKPVVTNAAVHAVVEEQLLDDKVVVFKYKKKKNYRRNIGHRQPITRIKITGITGYEDYPASTLEPEAVAS